jgi:predicted ATPase
VSRGLRDELDLTKRLEIIVAYLSNVISIRVKDDLIQGIGPEERRRQSFDGLKAMFLGESERKPIVLILEDIHWIDRTSEEFLLYLSSSVVKSRIMILALHRPGYRCPWAMSSSHLRIPVEPLSHPESEEMLRNVLKIQEVPQEVRQLVQSKAEGNPFFVEELIMELLEAGWIRREGDLCRLAGQGVSAHVPATVQDVIMARIDRLDDSLKQTLQMASVIGREFAFGILEKIAQPSHTLSPALLALQQCELIAEKSLYPELEYMFKNALTQDVAYNSLLLRRRRELHTRIAAAIEELKRNTLEEYLEVLAYHYKNGDQPEKSLEFLARAGEKAVELCSVEVAKTYFTEALTVSSNLPRSNIARARKRELEAQLQKIGGYQAGRTQETG